MNTALHIAVISLLAVLIYQDFEYRSVLWLIFPVLIVCQAVLSSLQIAWAELGLNVLINLMSLALLFLVLTLYFSLRNARWTNVINKYVGLGDVLFFMFLTLAFSPFNFLLFFVLSLLATLLIYALVVKTNLRKHRIPLLGCMSIAYMLVLCMEWVGRLNKFEDIMLSFY